MKTNWVAVGENLYHYHYGELKVTLIDDRYVVADGHTFLTSSIGHWVFTDPDMVGQENNDFDCPSGQTPAALIVDEEAVHPMFAGRVFGRKPAVKKTYAESPVGEKPAAKESAVGGLGDRSVTKKESAVGSKSDVIESAVGGMGERAASRKESAVGSHD